MPDRLDLDILEQLARDGRVPYTVIATQLGTSEATVRARVAKLEASGVLSIVALCNPISLGHVAVRLLVSTAGATPRSIGQAVARMPMVGYVALTAGRHDLYVEATCRDLPRLVELLDDIRRLPGVAGLQPLVLAEIAKDYSWTGLAGGTGRAAGQDAGQSA